MGVTRFRSQVKPIDATEQYAYQFIPTSQFNMNVAGTEDASLALTAEAESTTDNGILTNDNSTSMYGWRVVTGDVGVTNFMMLPDDMDVAAASNIAVLVNFSSGTTTRSHTFTVAYHPYTLTDVAANAVTSPATALDTVIAAVSEHDQAYSMQQTGWGVIDASTLSAVLTGVQWELTATTVNTSTATVHGLLFRYIRRYV